MLLELHKFLHFAENENEKKKIKRKRTIKVTFPNTVIKQNKNFWWIHCNNRVLPLNNMKLDFYAVHNNPIKATMTIVTIWEEKIKLHFLRAIMKIINCMNETQIIIINMNDWMANLNVFGRFLCVDNFFRFNLKCVSVIHIIQFAHSQQ